MNTEANMAAPQTTPTSPNCAEVTERVRQLEALVDKLTTERKRLVRENAHLRELADPREAPEIDPVPV